VQAEASTACRLAGARERQRLGKVSAAKTSLRRIRVKKPQAGTVTARG
jgi:hypothetical protein